MQLTPSAVHTMPRNAETIRQWRLLREIEARRGLTIRRMAELGGVSTRTIRRDLDALQEAGFPLYDELVDEERRWRLGSGPFHSVEDTGLTLAELTALYFGRALMERLVGTPFQADLTHAFQKLERGMGPRMRAFFDRLPSAIQAKPGPEPKQLDPSAHKSIDRLLDAVLHQRRLLMRYRSASSGTEKTYRIEPYRLVYAQGGLYLLAYVPSYEQVRTFAVERIRHLSPLNETFEISDGFGAQPMDDSLGVHEGTPEHVEVEFSTEVAPFVVERIWHPSQTVDYRSDGSIVISLQVCTDTALTTWILGYGAAARVLGPPHLISRISSELARASSRYAIPIARRKSSGVRGG